MPKHSAAWSVWITLIFIVGFTAINRGTAVAKDAEVIRSKIGPAGETVKQASGYPNNIRDGLAPAQYFRMTEVLLGNYDLTNAKQCLQKLMDNKTSPEAQQYADLLNNTAMPKEAVPDEAVNLLKQAELVEKQQDIEQATAMYQSLVKKYPKFEWAHTELAKNYAYYRQDQKNAEVLLEQSLALNPNNTQTLQTCITLANNKQQHEKAYEYCIRLRAVDPTYSSYHLDWELNNHDRSANLKNLIHRAAPRITPLAPQPHAEATQVSMQRPINETVSDAVKHNTHTLMLQTARQSMQQTTEREENYPPQMINERGEVQITFGDNVDTSGSFSNNLLAVRSDHRTQYWNKQGKQAFAKSFDEGLDFSEGLAAAKDGKWGFIDSTGQFVISNELEYATSFSDGLAAVVIEGNWGFINTKGEIVIEPIYEKAKPFSNGLALVKLRNKLGYIDKNGNLAIPATFDSGRPFSEGLAEVGILDRGKHELRLCYINTSGKVCLDTSKIEASAEPDAKEPDVYNLDDGKTLFGFKNATGMSSSDKRPRDFHCGLAGIKLGKNYGYINKDGKVVIPPVYTAAYDFSENLATVQPNNNFEKAVIDTSGTTVVGPQYKEISQFHDGIAAVNQWQHSSSNALWGYINKKGEQILPLQYFEATTFSSGLARVRPTPMAQASTKLAPVNDAPSVVTLPADQSLWAKTATKKIVAAWPAETACEVDKRTQFTFKLDQAGNVYDITFISGCASPNTMLATVHSLLFAMPFERQTGPGTIYLDIESDSSANPKITMSSAGERAAGVGEEIEDKSANAEDKILNGMPENRNSQDSSMLAEYMAEKLVFLCEKSAKYPDSPSVNAELAKIFNAYSLNATNAHDWLCVARSNPARLVLRQNPDNRDERSCNAPLGAIFQAWRLQKQNINLYELQDAYRHKIALDLLRSNGTEPLFLGIAAELMDQYSTAQKYYSQCSSSDFAKKLVKRFSSKLTAETISKFAGNAVNTKDWKEPVKWLPIDSEVLIAVLKPQKETKVAPEKMVSTLFESMQVMVGAVKNEKSEIQFALHSGRNFQAPREIGIGSQAGADIRIFATTPPELHYPATFEKITTTAESLEGFNVIDVELKQQYSQSSVLFIARPFANVEISATDRHYLRQILARIKSNPTDRAFPDSLPEWATIDLKSDCWSLRHYDKSCAHFDPSAPKTAVVSEKAGQSEDLLADDPCTGFTFCGNKGGSFKVSFHGSNPKTLKTLADGWNHYSKINTGQFWGTGKGPQDYKMSPLKVTVSADKKTTTAAGKTTEVTAPMLNIILMNQLGYMIAL
ncbi:MAG: WG repeat-containing protein [Candidatus Obscuribacterales bacterium]